MGVRIKESQRIDATDKVRCYQIANSKSKVQIFLMLKLLENVDSNLTMKYRIIFWEFLKLN